MGHLVLVLGLIRAERYVGLSLYGVDMKESKCIESEARWYSHVNRGNEES